MRYPRRWWVQDGRFEFVYGVISDGHHDRMWFWRFVQGRAAYVSPLEDPS